MSQSLAQAVGTAYTPSKMRHAQAQTQAAITRIAAHIHSGMSEGAACTLAREVLQEMGMDRVWHQVIVRFGADTLKIFNQKITPDTVLQTDDIFFIDLGVVWDGIEGDAGATFTVGNDAAMHECAAAAHDIWHECAQFWREHACSGQELYRHAQNMATERGWVLNPAVGGHRVSEFPHKVYQAGDLSALAETPRSGIWVLEIQLSHPERPFGAFYEDVLWD
ncbi:MAG: M24 family metallopeptidase [Neisseria sp.]|nr:M24 family metallopeptidase [Neisseria sp.]